MGHDNDWWIHPDWICHVCVCVRSVKLIQHQFKEAPDQGRKRSLLGGARGLCQDARVLLCRSQQPGEEEDGLLLLNIIYIIVIMKVGEKIAKEEAERKRLEMMEGWLRCAWCNAWNK